MRYQGTLYRPPSEADSYILQATIGCSWNKCTYCDMYREKDFQLRPLAECLADIETAGAELGAHISKVFIADGDALAMGLDLWLPLLQACRQTFPRLRRVSCYATAGNLLEKSDDELVELRAAGLELLYIGPESGDDETLRRIAKGATYADHVEAAERARRAGMKQSLIFLLGAGGIQRSTEHAEASARLATAMDPRFLSALTLTVIPDTPMARAQQKGHFELPDVTGLLRELRVLVANTQTSDAIFRTNHASNYLPIAGRLPRDRDQILTVLDEALSGNAALRPEWLRGL